MEELLAVALQSSHGLALGQVLDRDDFHSGRIALQAFVHPIVIAVENYSNCQLMPIDFVQPKLTGCHKATSSPLLSTLLDHLEQILPIVIVTDQMGTVNDENQWATVCLSSVQRDLFQLVEGSLDIQQSSGIARATDTEKTADVTDPRC